MRIDDAARGPDVLNDRAIAFLRPGAREESIRDDAALQGFVLMMVRRDESGHDDGARTVDDLGVGNGDVRRNLRDRLAVDQDVRLLEVSHPGVQGKHHASPKQNAAPPPLSDQPLKVRGRRGAQIAERAGVLIFR